MNFYTYRITNILLNKHYYGMRSCTCSPLEDLGKIYFSSSSDKWFIDDQKENPQNYKYKIVREVKTRQESQDLEIKLHKLFDVGKNKSFFNKAIQWRVDYTKKRKPIVGKSGVSKNGVLRNHNGVILLTSPLEISDTFGISRASRGIYRTYLPTKDNPKLHNRKILEAMDIYTYLEKHNISKKDIKDMIIERALETGLFA